MLRRRGSASGRRPRLSGRRLALLGGLLAVQRHEIDRIDVERREAAVAHSVRYHLPGEREQQPRALDHDQRVELIGRHVAGPEHARIGELELEQHLGAELAVTLELEVDLEVGLGKLLRVDVDLDVDGRSLLLGRERARRVRVLEREILRILRKRVEGRHLVGRGLGLRAAVRHRGVGHGKLLKLKELLRTPGQAALASEAARFSAPAITARPVRQGWSARPLARALAWMSRPGDPIWAGRRRFGTGHSACFHPGRMRNGGRGQTGSTMQDSLDVTTIIFLALAVFVIWRLRSVLGQKTGQEKPPLDPFSRREAPPPLGPAPRTAGGDNVVRLPGAVNGPTAATVELAPDRWSGVAAPGSPVAAGLDEIAKIEPGFDARGFVEGAKTAYEMIVT